MAQYILVYSHPSLGEQRFPLEEERTYRLGARGDNDIVIPQQDVSRHHAVVTVSGGRLHLTDLDSKNGTFVNGVREASCELHGGDQIGLSSATLMIVEAGVDSGSESSSGDAVEARSRAVDEGLDTTQHRLGASPDDLVALLEATGAAVARGGVRAPLDWAVERLGADAALVVYRDAGGDVAIVASEGDLTALVNSHADLVRMAADRVGGDEGKPGLVSQEEVSGSQLVVARLDFGHLLVLRVPLSPPSVGDLRALVAAQNAVLSAARAEGTSGRAGGEAGRLTDGHAVSLGKLFELPLAEGRSAFERLRVEQALRAAGGSWTDAASRLGVTRAGLYKLARRLGVTV